MYLSVNLNIGDLANYKTNKINETNELSDLSHINLFVGPNNAGKSRFMRAFLCNINELEYINDSQLLVQINSSIENFKNTQGFPLSDRYKFQPLQFFTNSKNENTKTAIQDVLKNGNFEGTSIYDNEVKVAVSNAAIEVIKNLEKIAIPIGRAIYIPTLRGLRNIGNHVDIYSTRTKSDYFSAIDDKRNIEIFTGLNLYNDVRKLLLGNSQERKNIKDFEDFISKTFFSGKNFTIIPREGKDVVYIKIGEAEDFPIHELGDGIQSLIILLYPLFFNRSKDLCVFYEEPDMFLHPGFQRIFIDAIKEFKNCQFFITTHSNHFLDMTLDYDSMSIYMFEQNDTSSFKITNIDKPDFKILEHLGVRNASVFLTNCTIWVEGITDRMYVRHFLKLYYKDNPVFLEDVHYSFVEYGGANITHWSFLDSEDNTSNITIDYLCGKIFLITDSDNAKAVEKKHERINKLKERLKERFYCDEEIKEIENMLTVDTINGVICKNDTAAKSNNDILHENYKKKPLGKFIDSNWTTSKKYEDGNTIANKVDFAKKAIEIMDNQNGKEFTFDKLSLNAQTLTKAIYEFIKTNNQI